MQILKSYTKNTKKSAKATVDEKTVKAPTKISFNKAEKKLNKEISSFVKQPAVDDEGLQVAFDLDTAMKKTIHSLEATA